MLNEMNLIPKRNDVKRFQTRDRRRGYVAPTEADTRCPYFHGLFARIGMAAVVNDYCGVCHDRQGEQSCDYNQMIAPGSLNLCHRYWKKDMSELELVQMAEDPYTGDWQTIQGEIHTIRHFKDKKALVRAEVLKKAYTNINLGNFMTEWETFNDNRDVGNWGYVNGMITNYANQSARSAWYHPYHVLLQNYTFSFNVKTTDTDDDMFGCIFRFDPTTLNFYSFEWDGGGYTDADGMSIFKNTRNAYGWSKRRLAQIPRLWTRNHTHKITVTVTNIEIQVEVKHGADGTIYNLHAIDDDNPFLYGAWGPMTESQANTYFWSIEGQFPETFSSDKYAKLEQWIELEKLGTLSSTKYFLSHSMKEYFQEALDQVLQAEKIDDTTLDGYNFKIINDNVFEPIFFQNGLVGGYTLDLNDRICIGSWDYETPSTHPFTLLIADPITTPNVSYVYTSLKSDVYITNVITSYDRIHLTDSWEWKIRGSKVHFEPYTTELYKDLVWNPEVEIGERDTVQFLYQAQAIDIQYFRGQYIDTHQKIFKVRNNELRWHKELVREPENYDS